VAWSREPSSWAPSGATVQATWNLLERSAGPALAEAYTAGWGVIVKEVIANGRLGPRDSSPALQPFRELAAGLGTGPDVLAMAAVLAQPWVSVVLSGAASVAHIESHVRALSLRYDEELDARLRGMVEAPSMYWARRGALPWN